MAETDSGAAAGDVGARSARFTQAIAAIDRANAGDPMRIRYQGAEYPKEILHARLLTDWVTRLAGGEPSEALLLAARAHHIRRWEKPRSAAPAGRAGYLRWRSGLHEFHAHAAGEILREHGYDDTTIARVGTLIRKRGLGRDPEVQILEDGLCLVFLETQLDELVARSSRETMRGIIRKTWRKVSPAGREHALALVTPEQRELIEDSLNTRPSPE